MDEQCERALRFAVGDLAASVSDSSAAAFKVAGKGGNVSTAPEASFLRVIKSKLFEELLTNAVRKGVTEVSNKTRN